MSYLDKIDNPAFKNEIDRLVAAFNDPSEVYFTNGVPRWVSNDRVPPKDVRDLWLFVGHDFDAQSAKRVHDDEQRAWIEDYRRARANISEEQKAEEAFERRAAFGPGETVMNVLTGETYNT